MTHPNARATEAEQVTDAQHMEVGGILACIYVDSANTVEKATPPLRVAPIRQQLRTLVKDRDAALSRAEQAEKERDEANAKAGACNYAAKELVGGALKAVKVAKAAFEREGWEDGPTIPEAETTLGNAIGNITDFGVDGYLNRIKTLTDLTVKLKSERDAARREVEVLRAEVKTKRVVARYVNWGNLDSGIEDMEADLAAEAATDALARREGGK